MSAQAPVGTTLAILERTLKVMSAVQARIHYSMKQEFKLLKEIIADYTPKEYAYEQEDVPTRAKQSDYKVVEVIPVSDPNAATMAQRVVQYQAVMQLAQAAPQIYDLPQLHRQMLDVLGIKNADKLVPLPDDMKPVDPISENMAVLKGKPIDQAVLSAASVTALSSGIESGVNKITSNNETLAGIRKSFDETKQAATSYFNDVFNPAQTDAKSKYDAATAAVNNYNSVKASFDDVYNKDLKVMDMTAFTLCKENKLPIIVFNMNAYGNLKALVEGKKIGTLVTM